MGDFVWNFVFFIILIGILVTIHELGHFLAARFFGVRVYRFSIGFGPVLFKHVGKDGIEYAISLLPIGGYVKMKGEADDPVQGYDKNLAQQDTYPKTATQNQQNKSQVIAETDFAELRSGYDSYEQESELNNDSFATLPCWKRFVILFAGPFSNIVLAFFLFFVVNLLGVNAIKPVVGDIVTESIADVSGLHTYDLILQVGEHEVSDWSAVATEMIASGGDKVDVTVSGHKGTEPSHIVTLDFTGVTFTPEFDLFEYLGFTPAVSKLTSTLNIVEEGSAAYDAGIQVGDKIIAVNGRVTPNWLSVAKEININKDKDQDLVFTIVRKVGAVKTNPKAPDLPPLHSVMINNYEMFLPELVRAVAVRYANASFTVDMRNEDLSQYYLVEASLRPKRVFDERTQEESLRVGIGIQGERDDELFFVRKFGFIESISRAIHDTAYMSAVVVRSLNKLVVGDISIRSVSGPVSIAVTAGTSASVGFEYFLWVMAVISINLGVFNLLPIPVLDGGQIVYVWYEAITKRKPNAKVQGILTAICFSLFMALIVFTIFNDITNLF